MDSGRTHSIAFIKQQWHKLKSFWTKRPSWQKVAVGFVLVLLLFDPIRQGFNNIFKPEQLYEPAFKRIRNAIVKGSRSLVDQIPEETTMNFREGTLVIWLDGSSVSDRKPKQLKIESTEDPNRMVTLEKDEQNIVRVRLDFPSLGTVERSTIVKTGDIERKNLPFVGAQDVVFIAFTWNLNEATSDLYVNGVSTVWQRQPSEEGETPNE
jgi:hypothetical protein